ncbi:hypothetical protein GCM10027347_59840 [Larkinella harenae]
MIGKWEHCPYCKSEYNQMEYDMQECNKGCKNVADVNDTNVADMQQVIDSKGVRTADHDVQVDPRLIDYAQKLAKLRIAIIQSFAIPVKDGIPDDETLCQFLLKRPVALPPVSREALQRALAVFNVRNTGNSSDWAVTIRKILEYHIENEK